MRGTLILAGLLVLTLAVPPPRPAGAETVVLQNESFTASHDLESAPIMMEIDTGCHGGYKLTGLDTPGEWVEYDLTVAALGTWSIHLFCRGDYNAPYQFQMTATGDDSGLSQTVDILYNGLGYT